MIGRNQTRVAVLHRSFIALAGAALIASCGDTSHDDAGHAPHSDKPVVAEQPADYNATDVGFVDNVIAQNRQGVELAALVPDHSTNTAVATFAAASASTRRSEIAVVKALRVQWSSSQDDPWRPTKLKGPVGEDVLTTLRSSRGAAFDKGWLQAMNVLSRAGVEVAGAEVARGKNEDAIGLARQISEARPVEIEQIKSLSAG